MSTLYRPRIYRLGSGALVLGIAGTVGAIWLGWSPLVHLITGSPMMVTNGKLGITYPAPVPAMRLDLEIAGFFLAVSLYLALSWANAIVIADETGILGRNAFGMVRFRATWSEIDHVDLIAPPTSRGGSVGTYVFHAGGQRLKMYGYADVDELIGLVKDRAPHVEFD